MEVAWRLHGGCMEVGTMSLLLDFQDITESMYSGAGCHVSKSTCGAIVVPAGWVYSALGSDVQ